jgi:aspartate/methionine/tyrosine aminotransferase
VFPPRGTYFIVVDHTPFGFRTDTEFCRHLIEHVGVAAIPTSVFYHDPRDGHTLVRFAFCKTESTLREGLQRMNDGLRR